MFWPGYLFLKFTESCLGLFWIFELVNTPFLLLSFLFFLTFLFSVFSTLLFPKSPPRFQGPVHKPTEGSSRHSAQPNCELTTQKNLKEKIMAWSVYCVCVCSKHFNQNHFITSHWLSYLHFFSFRRFMQSKFVKFTSWNFEEVKSPYSEVPKGVYKM